MGTYNNHNGNHITNDLNFVLIILITTNMVIRIISIVITAGVLNVTILEPSINTITITSMNIATMLVILFIVIMISF